MYVLDLCIQGFSRAIYMAGEISLNTVLGVGN